MGWGAMSADGNWPAALCHARKGTEITLSFSRDPRGDLQFSLPTKMHVQSRGCRFLGRAASATNLSPKCRPWPQCRDDGSDGAGGSCMQNDWAELLSSRATERCRLSAPRENTYRRVATVEDSRARQNCPRAEADREIPDSVPAQTFVQIQRSNSVFDFLLRPGNPIYTVLSAPDPNMYQPAWAWLPPRPGSRRKKYRQRCHRICTQPRHWIGRQSGRS